MGLSLNDSIYCSVFFFLTGLHFFHLVVGFFLLSLRILVNRSKQVRLSDVHLFNNLQVFYWHFLEILWIFIFLGVLSSYNTKYENLLPYIVFNAFISLGSLNYLYYAVINITCFIWCTNYDIS